MASAVKKVVTVIPVKPVEVIKGLPENSKRRVAAYCRVSTDNVAQESSFESQVNYYTNLINSRSDWTMIEIYADEGISGTSAEKRTDYAGTFLKEGSGIAPISQRKWYGSAKPTSWMVRMPVQPRRSVKTF